MIAIDVRELGQGKKKFRGEEPGDVLDLAAEEDIRVDGPVRYDLTAEMASECLVVRGTVGVEISFACVRCGVFFSKRVADSSFCRVFEDTAKDIDAADLTADVRESIILAFPTGPLCDEACKGLCSQCGADLNKAACKCERELADDRWNALDALK
jgi:uncharacterized protein